MHSVSGSGSTPKEYFVQFKCYNVFLFHYYFLHSHAKQLVINN